MSRILCVDTSSFICSVSVFENLSLISSHSSEVERSHSKLINLLLGRLSGVLLPFVKKKLIEYFYLLKVR